MRQSHCECCLYVLVRISLTSHNVPVFFLPLACLSPLHLITASARILVHNSVTSIWNEGILWVEQVLLNCGIGDEDSADAVIILDHLCYKTI